ncbi:DUF4422 domain-containing protein [Campylobacter lari]|uniref:DUF4422 domain-containing protein n=1 Tax=Campylobacter lari TaxID=201 RepID=UPI00372AF3BF
MQNNLKVKILVGYHKPAALFKDDIFEPIHLGRKLESQTTKDGNITKEEYQWMCENMIGDDTGDNISHLNRYLCELTGIYWAWKNYDQLGNPDYVGFSHYRRHLIFDDTFQLAPRKWANFSPTYENISLEYKHLINIKKLKNKEKYDIFAPEIFDVTVRDDVSVSSIVENFQTYCNDMHGLNLLTELLENDDKLVEYKKYSNIKSESSYFLANVFVMKKEIFFQYCDFLFYIIFKLWHIQSNELKLNSDLQQKRQLAYISEFITSIYIKKQFDLNRKIKCFPISFIENTSDSIVLNELNVLKIKEKAKHCNFISFDIFDTLLVRPYTSPYDVFFHLEKHFSIDGFAKTRIEAENRACILLDKKIVSYDEIYACMPKKYHFIKNKEEEIEFQTLYANPEMKNLLDYFISIGKKIILTSDMYYPLSFFKKLLEKNKIQGYLKIYISGEVKCSKHHGDIYNFIIKDLNISPSDILHIGDNYNADYRNALVNGWNAYYYESPLRQFFKTFPRLNLFFNKYNNLTCHIIIGILLKKWLYDEKKIKDYWDYFGYFYGGPVCYGLSKFVFDEAVDMDLKEFIFVARDGFTIKMIFDLLKNQFKVNIKTDYVCASRTLNLQINLEYDKELSWVDKSDSIIKLYKQQIKDFQNIDEEALDEKTKQKLVEKNLFLLQKYAFSFREKYYKYINKFNFSEKNIGLFDISAGAFNSMKLIKSILPDRNIFGYYWMVAGDRYRDKFIYKTFNEQNYFLDNYEFSEFIITAPELPIKMIDRFGNFERIENAYENERVEKYSKIYLSEVNFSKDLIDIFQDYHVVFDNKTILDFVNIFLKTIEQDDKYYFNNIYHGMNESHTKYKKLFDCMVLPKVENTLIGAVDIVKGHLSYRIGYLFVNAKTVRSKISLPFALFFTIIKYKIRKKIINMLYDLNIMQKPLPLEKYSDFNEAMKVKKYLSYQLGNEFLNNPLFFIFKVKNIYKKWKKNH